MFYKVSYIYIYMWIIWLIQVYYKLPQLKSSNIYIWSLMQYMNQVELNFSFWLTDIQTIIWLA